MTEKEQLARELIMQAVGDCVAEGVFPPEPLPWFDISEKNGVVATNAAAVCAEAFGMSVQNAADEIAKRVYLIGSGFSKLTVSKNETLAFLCDKNCGA